MPVCPDRHAAVVAEEGSTTINFCLTALTNFRFSGLGILGKFPIDCSSRSSHRVGCGRRLVLVLADVRGRAPLGTRAHAWTRPAEALAGWGLACCLLDNPASAGMPKRSWHIVSR